MSKAQIIKTPNGEEMVLLPRDEYEDLLAAAFPMSEEEEDAADVAIYDQRKAELAASGGALLPAEVSAAVLHGDSPLKALRKWRDMTQQELSSRTGIGQGYISDLESRRRKGTDETLALIAKALDDPE